MGHGNVDDLIFGSIELIVQRLHLADGGLAGGRHVALLDDIHKTLGIDLVKFPVGAARDGHRQRRNSKAGLSSLGGGVEGGGVRHDTNHKYAP